MAVSSYFLCPQCTAYLNYNKNNHHKLEYSRQIIALVRQLTVQPSATSTVDPAIEDHEFEILIDGKFGRLTLGIGQPVDHVESELGGLVVARP